MDKSIPSISYHKIKVVKMRGGRRPLWNSYLNDALIAVTYPFAARIVGAGGSADLAIRDYQKAFRSWASNPSKHPCQ